MEENKPMSVLIVEDDPRDCAVFQSVAEGRTDIKLVEITNSADRALQLVKERIPEGIILDIELSRGIGNGISFLDKYQEGIQNGTIGFRSVIFVNTNSLDDLLYQKLRDSNVSLIFYKKQIDYSPDTIFDQLISLRKSVQEYNISNHAATLPVSSAPTSKNLSNRISTELNNIGIPVHLKGRQHIHDAILYLIEHDGEADCESVFNYIARTSGKRHGSITNLIQTAINYAWKETPYQDLLLYYNFKISDKRGIPTNTEFIYNLKDKILKDF